MARACRLLVGVVVVLYALALGLFLIGQFGLFGAERDPLAGVFLVLLGLPWNRFIDGLPEATWPWLVALSPILNLIVIGALCRISRAPRG
jgi:hypothetical protein